MLYCLSCTLWNLRVGWCMLAGRICIQTVCAIGGLLVNSKVLQQCCICCQHHETSSLVFISDHTRDQWTAGLYTSVCMFICPCATSLYNVPRGRWKYGTKMQDKKAEKAGSKTQDRQKGQANEKSKLEVCLRNDRRYRHSYNQVLTGTYTRPLRKGVISNDLVWLSEIFNDVKHRAVSLRVLSFLCHNASCLGRVFMMCWLVRKSQLRLLFHILWLCNGCCIDPLDSNGNASSNNTKLVHWPLMGGLLHLVQRTGDWAGPQPAQASPRCTKKNVTAHPSTASLPITVLLYNGPLLCRFIVPISG